MVNREISEQSWSLFPLTRALSDFLKSPFRPLLVVLLIFLERHKNRLDGVAARLFTASGGYQDHAKVSGSPATRLTRP